MQKIKILRIIARLNIGGPAQNATFLTEGFNNDRFECLLIAGVADASEGDMSYLAKERNIRVIIIPQLKRELSFINDIISFIKIVRIVFKSKPDIIHTHTAKAGAIGRFAGIIYRFLGNNKLKLVHTFHGHVLEGYFGRLRNNVFVLVERILACFTDKLDVVSDAIRDDLIRLRIGNSDKIQVVHLGLELERFFDIKYNSDAENRIKIGIIGRLVPIKNHRFFIGVAQLYIKRFPETSIEFYIVGDGELKSQLVEYVEELGLSRIIKFLGWEKDLAKIYSSLDIVCLTSLNEGTPVSIIEALASGRPVVSTNVGGVKDILKPICEELGINESKILIDSGDKEKFVETLEYFISDRNIRNSFGGKGREFVKNNFLKERLIRDMNLLYTDLLKRSKL